MAQVVNLSANAGDARDSGLAPGLGRSPGGGNGNPLQYSCQENLMDRGDGGLHSMGSQRVRYNRSTEHTVSLTEAEKLCREVKFGKIGWIMEH